jgi:2-succinyl-5-enolpyruvyl-6-hydroxy-3-cyclohexene-1-carboxylate synthase
VNFALLAGSYGIDYGAVEDWPQLIALVQNLPESGIRLLEVRCDRKQDAQWLQKNLPEFAKIAHETEQD